MRKLIATVAAAACLMVGSAMAQTKEIKIGFFPGPYADQFKRGIQPILEQKGYKTSATEFTNIIQINASLMDGSLDLNIFQNRAFMESYNAQNKADLVEALRIPSAPLGVYSRKIKSLAELKDGMSVSLSNDPTNLARSLMFLEKLGLIKLKPGIEPAKSTEKDVAENPKNLKLVPLDAPQIPRTMQDVDLAAALGNHILAAGMLLTDAIALEDPAPQYQIIIAMRAGNLQSAWAKDLLDAYKSQAFKTFIENDPKTKGFSKPEYWR